MKRTTPQPSTPQTTDARTNLARRHLRIGWTGLLVFLTFGIVLEILHALKLGLYLDVRNSTRRLMWTLAHSHGTLFSLIHIAFALSLDSVPGTSERWLRWISVLLVGGLVALPTGFFLGGLQFYGGDPGLGVLLVPLGAVMMLFAVATFVVRLFRE